MAAIIIVLAVIVLVIWAVSSSSSSRKPSAPPKNTSRSNASRTAAAPTHIKRAPITRQNFRQNLETLTDREDVHFQAAPETQEYIAAAKVYSASRRKTLQRSSASSPQVSLDMSWANDLPALLEQTDTLYSNVMLTCSKKLASERFNYYNKLYYRSFTAADLCHAKGQEIQHCYRNQIDPLFKRLKDPKDPLRLQKSDYNQLCTIAKNMHNIQNFLFSRRDQLNRQTAVIRHKIGTDCGRGGQAWEASILASKGAR